MSSIFTDASDRWWSFQCQQVLCNEIRRAKLMAQCKFRDAVHASRRADDVARIRMHFALLKQRVREKAA